MAAAGAWPAPCESCAHELRCAREELTCARFDAWARDGRAHDEMPQVPRRLAAPAVVAGVVRDRAFYVDRALFVDVVRAQLEARGAFVSIDGAVRPKVAATILQVEEQTLRAWRSRGRGPAFDRRSGVWYRLADLYAWLRQTGAERRDVDGC